MALSHEERVRGTFIHSFYVYLEDYEYSFKRSWNEALQHTADCFGISIEDVADLVDELREHIYNY